MVKYNKNALTTPTIRRTLNGLKYKKAECERTNKEVPDWLNIEITKLEYRIENRTKQRDYTDIDWID